MSDVVSFLPLALIVLVCPLMMGAMGVGAWFVARARGEKKDLSVGCMGGHGQHQPTEAEEPKLREQVAHLEQEVQVLKAQSKSAGAGDSAAHELAPTRHRN